MVRARRPRPPGLVSFPMPARLARLVARGGDEMTGPASIQALIVDLFGTLVPKWPQALSTDRKRRMAKAIDVEEHLFRKAWAARWWDRELGRVSLEGCIADVLEEVAPSGSPETMSALVDLWLEPVADHLAATPRPDAVAALERARAAGLKIGLVSNAGVEVPGVFRRSPLAGLVDVAVYSSTVGVAKPDRRIYLAACQELAVSPSRCLYVGDGGNDELQGALEVGMRPVLLRVDDEIAHEGLPSGAAAWEGPEIGTFDELWETMALPDGPSP